MSFSGKLSKGSQLLKYLKNTRVRYGIYTNGKEIKLISKLRIRNGYTPRTYFHLRNVEDFITYSDILRLLSKSSLKNGKLDKLIKLFHNDYWEWEKGRKRTIDKDKQYTLPLEYARSELKQL